tara:strand:- start:147 stop:413 length:267 start_codon:yes stop_codon:yes gene_type:complete
VPTEKDLAQRILNKQRKSDYLKKKRLTKIEEAIDGLSNNDQIIWKEMLETKQIISLYLEYNKDTDKFNKFVKAKVKEFEQRSEDTKGT